VNLKTLLMAPIVLAAVGYGGTKAYIYFSVKSELDNLVEMAAPFAEISYGGISSDLRGKLIVTDFYLASHAGGETMQIDTIELTGPGPGFLFDLSGGFKTDDPPRNLSLGIKRFSVPADQGFGAKFNVKGTGGSVESAYQPEPCTLGGIFQHKGLYQMGVDTLVADVQFGYSFNQDTGEAELSFDYQLDDTESFSMAMELGGVQIPAAMAMGSLPRLGNFRLSYQVEPGYTQRMLNHCAKQKKQAPEAFVESLFDIPDNQYARQLGFIPGPGIRSVLKTVASKGGRVDVAASPPAGINPALLAFDKPEDIVAMLGLEVSLNDKPVTDISFTIQDGIGSPSWMPQRSSLAQSGGRFSREQESGSDQAEASSTKQRNKRVRLSYQDTKVSDLHKYLGSRVRLYTGDAAQPKKGFLISLKGQRASVEQSVHSGNMTAHLNLSDIKKAEVLRRLESAALAQ